MAEGVNDVIYLKFELLSCYLIGLLEDMAASWNQCENSSFKGYFITL